MGLKLGYSDFPHYHQNNHGLSGAYVTCICWGLNVKINTRWNTARHVKILDAFVLRLFLSMWSAKTRIPPIWDPWLTTPLHGAGLGSPFIFVVLSTNSHCCFCLVLGTQILLICVLDYGLSKLNENFLGTNCQIILQDCWLFYQKWKLLYKIMIIIIQI